MLVSPAMKKVSRQASDFLEIDYQARKSRNYRYSKRSYAKLLGISSGRLTDILAGRYPITSKKAASWAKLMVIPEVEIKTFLLLTQNEQQNRVDKRSKSKLTSSKQLNHDQFAVVSDWEYFAFMALVETAEFRSDRQWISRKMRISEERVQEIIQLLQQQEFITIDAEGTIKNAHNSMSTLSDIPSSVLQKANRERILLGLERMHLADVLMRDITSLSLPVDKKQIPKAKKLVRKFKGEMLELLRGSNSSEVYNLNIQFVPMTDPEIV